MGQTVRVQPPKVGVIIVAFNDPENLTRLFESLKKATGDYTLQTVVVDNSTSAPAAAKIKTLVSKAPVELNPLYVAQKENLGFAGGVNAGLKAVNPDYYWLINSDTTVDSKAISALLATAQETQAAIIGSQILYGDDQTVYYAGGKANNWLGIVQHPGRNQPAPTSDTARPVTFVNGCTMFMPAQTIQKYGGMFESYFMYYEDTDLCAHILQMGGKLYYEPKSIVQHYTPHSDNKSVTALYFLTRNHWLYINRNLAWYYQLVARPAVLVFQLFRWLKYVTKKDFRRAITAGWRDAIKHQYGPKPTI